MTPSWRRDLEEELGERRDPLPLSRRASGLTLEELRATRTVNELRRQGVEVAQAPLPYIKANPWPSSLQVTTGEWRAMGPEERAALEERRRQWQQSRLDHPRFAGLPDEPPAEQLQGEMTAFSPEDPTDANLAALNAKATAEMAKIDAKEARQSSSGPWSTIGSNLPPNAQAAWKLRVKHPRILKVDIRPIARETDETALRAGVRAFYAVPRRGYPLLGSMQQAVSAILYVERADAMGLANRTLEQMATIAGHCVRTFQRCKDLLVALGLIDQANSVVPAPDGGAYWLDANVYVPTVDVAPAPLPADVGKPDPVLPAAVSRALGGFNRLAALFGLFARPRGLNTTPLRTHPAPA
jgi:hypothetical protein